MLLSHDYGFTILWCAPLNFRLLPALLYNFDCYIVVNFITVNIKDALGWTWEANTSILLEYGASWCEAGIFLFWKKRGGTLNTIQSTLDRLFKKGLLLREKQGHAFQYRAAIERDAFLGNLINKISNDFGGNADNALLAAFSSLSSDLDNSQLDELERLIDQRRLLSNKGS